MHLTHDVCADAPDLDEVVAAAPSDLGGVQQVLDRYPSLAYDDKLEALRVIGCGHSLLALIPITPKE